MKRILLTLASLTSSVALAQFAPTKPTEVFSDLTLLRAAGAKVLAQDPRTNVGYAQVDAMTLGRMSQLNHALHRCAGFEALPSLPANFASGTINVRQREMSEIFDHAVRDRNWAGFSARRFAPLPKRPEIEKAIASLSEDNLREFVTWASTQFPSRDNRQSNPNVAVAALVERLKALGARYHAPLQIEVIDHQSTKQKSVVARLVGTSAPNEVVVLGGHFDSINMQWGGDRRAPGADDNASGSANIFEALRVVLEHGPNARTLEFYWYAGEESGLLGSAEIAQKAKEQKKQVVAVLQLDMTSFPGAGEFTLGSETDFTSAWLRDFLVSANATYIGAKIVEDQCGYGCSDHASWYRRGYPTLMPFEATLRTMNERLHTPNDVIFQQTNFKHSMVFSKIATVFALELANTNARQPY